MLNQLVIDDDDTRPAAPDSTFKSHAREIQGQDPNPVIVPQRFRDTTQQQTS